MSVLVSVIGSDKKSDEYQAALKLKNIIQKSIPQNVIGEIVLYSSANLVGQTVKDVDLIMLGILQNYDLNLEFVNQENQYVKESVSIKSFCTTIEVKSHSIDGISRIGTDFYVDYSKGKHCVTEQSNKQKLSAMNFFQKTLSFTPFVTNLIWFTEITRLDLNDLLKVDSREMPANVLARDFKFSDVMQLLVWQKNPYISRKKYVFDSNYENCSVSDIQKALDLFSRVKETMGEQTRQKIEMISRKGLSVDSLIPQDGKMPICRGRAGTGKTIALIQTAIKLVDEEYARVLMLTYNKALVSDVRRLFALSELPDLFNESCVHIATMHSFFYRIINYCMYSGKLSGETFISKYENYLLELLEFIGDDEDGIQCIKDIAQKDNYLNWDYVLIDEAQDWTKEEQKLLTLLFDNDHIIVADGGKQFVRSVDVCDWSIIKNKENIKLKYCLRQKNNIIKFINRFFEEYSGVDKGIISSEKLLGGKVIIINNADKEFDCYKEEIQKLKEVGNIAYDMLFLVPHEMVNREKEKSFLLTDMFEDHGLYLWDGTNAETREDYTVQADEVRVLQYDSARGLEGWCVCCLKLDKMVNEKRNEFTGKSNPLFLKSIEDSINEYIDNWLMIAMTRAIDTLIISIEDAMSKEGRILKKLSNDYPDYISWI